MLVRYLRLVVIVFIGLNQGATIALGDNDPQVRVYKSTTQDPYAPITPVVTNPSEVDGIKDPTLKTTVDISVKENPPVKKKPKYRPSKIRFKQVNVTGRKSQPRVAFRRRPLKVQRSDQDLKRDFYRKMFNVEPGLQ